MSSLKKLRKKSGLSQCELGTKVFDFLKINCSSYSAQKKVSLWENSLLLPSPKEVVALSNILGVSQEVFSFSLNTLEENLRRLTRGICQELSEEDLRLILGNEVLRKKIIESIRKRCEEFRVFSKELG
ncbi:hypothetical protein A3B18_03310 [Candidatus Giovannonibacteria bacterium RIFCSPLOWO2_01_FULL_46_13]|uniref:HTH cro/C1-type domain-containing protein n=1 Tax=Candidatus Giovannonibacteria bacterium RIFCSPLOWO2_01_FULL_46_13 TaxID=1798352 RepID=A0A1F5X3A1_9BACT|nr:MAG: hypothetical protein A3B18_03310 [Candidatus Giovannonibacteria bacterium RIFCSPLOWO2_01_FULL_46_13]